MFGAPMAIINFDRLRAWITAMRHANDPHASVQLDIGEGGKVTLTITAKLPPEVLTKLRRTVQHAG